MTAQFRLHVLALALAAGLSMGAVAGPWQPVMHVRRILRLAGLEPDIWR
jgi:hypothetical protein